uniref:RFC n=1 Tax=Acipenser iridovirus-European TaxID=1851774 RepID=A0A345WEF7_9VIRU|nr:RFC [Acipenser iridovirus-European]AXJ91443.1 RFC [Acipenser iridovirus-European]AXJ91444.1 RFC [Acipenser iridovirus-European]
MDKGQYTLWVEKYRPKRLSDMVQQENILTLFKNIISCRDVPHMLFYGPSGTGKTTVANIIFNKIFIKHKKDLAILKQNDIVYKKRLLCLNASDLRGINVVREEIKNFVTSSIHRYANVPDFKIIILDEADAMTLESQYALRRLIENYSQISRFIFICNYECKIIPAIKSRCQIRFFPAISEANMRKIIYKITNVEKICFNPEHLQSIISSSNGDVRKLINLLQQLKEHPVAFFSHLTLDLNIQYNSIYKLLMTPNLSLKFFYDEICEFIYQNNKSERLLKDFIFFFIKCTQLDEESKVKIIKKASFSEYKVKSGCNIFLQFYDLLVFIYVIIWVRS